jgi:hypothetical protein
VKTTPTTDALIDALAAIIRTPADAVAIFEATANLVAPHLELHDADPDTSLFHVPVCDNADADERGEDDPERPTDDWSAASWRHLRRQLGQWGDAKAIDAILDAFSTPRRHLGVALGLPGREVGGEAGRVAVQRAQVVLEALRRAAERLRCVNTPH